MSHSNVLVRNKLHSPEMVTLRRCGVCGGGVDGACGGGVRDGARDGWPTVIRGGNDRSGGSGGGLPIRTSGGGDHALGGFIHQSSDSAVMRDTSA